MLSILMLFSASLNVLGQHANLIPNESFEERDSTIVIGHPVPCPNESGEIVLATDWHASAGSVDYFHACAVGSDYPDYGVPTNIFGYQEAMDGDAYALFAVFAEGVENWREYIEVELKEPLVRGRVYELSFFVNLPDERKYAISEVGALLTKESTSGYSGTEYFNAQPQVVNAKERILDDKVDWMEITDTFTVEGGEKFLTIGCFEPYSNLTIEVTYDSVGLYNPGCAYFLDMVTLKEVGTVGIRDLERAELEVYPNPASGQVSIRLNGSSTRTTSGITLRVVDVVGRDCFSRSLRHTQGTTSFAMTEVLDVGQWPNGVYVVMLTDGDGNRHTERLVVRH